MKRFIILIIACTLFAVQPINAKKCQKPNIILILVDDMGWTDLGCMGSPFYKTPNIDQLATEGIKFTDAYAACTVCSPSRAAILTGRYPARHGITSYIKGVPKEKLPTQNPEGYEDNAKFKMLTPENHLWMELDEITIAEILKEQGYATCHVGKWHLGHDKWWPNKQGFDHNIGGCEMGLPPSYFDPFKGKGKNARQIENLPSRKVGEYLTDREGDEAIAFIRAEKDQPFFLYLSHYAVHGPLMAPEEDEVMFLGNESELHRNKTYAAMIWKVDEQVGKIIKELKTLGLEDNTLIIFTSDNGGVDPDANNHPHKYVTKNTPLRAGKCWPYEGGIRVPAIAWGPSFLQASGENNTPICGVDFLPTFCDLAGAKVPKDRTIDGESILPLLKGRKKKTRALFWHFPHYQHATPNSIIREGDWKLIWFYEQEKGELYNLKNDISETTDLSEKYPKIYNDLKLKLDGWLDETHAKLPKFRSK